MRPRARVRSRHERSGEPEGLSERQLLAVTQAAPVGLFAAILGSGLVLANDAMVEITGHSREELIGGRGFRWVHPDDRGIVQAAFSNIHTPGQSELGVECRLIRPDHEVRWVRVHASAVPGETPLTWVGSMEDVTATKGIEVALLKSEAFLRDEAAILEMIATRVPLDATLAEICRRVEAHLESARCSWRLDRDVDEGDADSESSPEHGTQAGVWSVAVRDSTDGPELGTFVVRTEDARELTVAEQGRVADAAQLAAIAIERATFEHTLAHRAHHDPLTGLPNRALFGELLDHALARAQRTDTSLALLFVDLDHFKEINDDLGHSVGDELLISLGRRLEAMLRPGDIVARFGGDEFMVLCEDLNAETAEELATTVGARIVEIVGLPFSFASAGEEYRLSASVGIALAVTGTERPEDLVRNADIAMYRAKELGKSRYEFFDDELRGRALLRNEAEAALRAAIARQEFRVFYQPVMSVSAGNCIGVEAFVRWEHPERGLLGPADFVPLAEETGLIVPIDAWVLEQACAQAVKWQLERPDGEPFHLSVNLTGRQLRDANFADLVGELLERTGLQPEELCFEVTERVLMEDLDRGINAVKALKDLGVRVSIDDFGTGYTSLGYLRQFQVDGVKIDRSFVGRLGADAGEVAMVTAIVDLGHALGITVTGEGVETDAQLSKLRSMGVDAAQGFLFAHPQPADEFGVEVLRF